MKKLLIIDARMIGPFGHGISKYVEGIAESFQDGDALTDLLVQSANGKTLNDLDILFLIASDCPKNSPVLKFKTVIVNESTYHPKSWIVIPKILKALKADLFFNPTFASYPYLPCAYVQTVHDLNHLHFGNFAQKLYYQTLLKPSIRNAHWVFTVSEAVKAELVEWAKIDPHKIKVFYNRFSAPVTVGAEKTKAILDRYHLKPHAYFLCVSNDKPHKNTEMLISAHQDYFQGRKSSDEITAGWSKAFRENADQAGSQAADARFPLVLTLPETSATLNDPIRKIGNVGDETLSVLLRNCAGFYFPSLYEGFGRPPVEAALCGVRWIVASDIPVHREAEALANSKFRFIKV
jgi:glycosyltransferase involved in cell wall biosynthesis